MPEPQTDAWFQAFSNAIKYIVNDEDEDTENVLQKPARFITKLGRLLETGSDEQKAKLKELLESLSLEQQKKLHDLLAELSPEQKKQKLDNLLESLSPQQKDDLNNLLNPMIREQQFGTLREAMPTLETVTSSTQDKDMSLRSKVIPPPQEATQTETQTNTEKTTLKQPSNTPSSDANNNPFKVPEFQWQPPSEGLTSNQVENFKDVEQARYRAWQEKQIAAAPQNSEKPAPSNDTSKPAFSQQKVNNTKPTNPYHGMEWDKEQQKKQEERIGAARRDGEKAAAERSAKSNVSTPAAENAKNGPSLKELANSRTSTTDPAKPKEQNTEQPDSQRQSSPSFTRG